MLQDHLTISSPDCTLHIACDYSSGMMESRAECQWNSCPTPPFQYCNNESDCSVQCAVRNRSCETTVCVYTNVQVQV